MRLSPPGRRTAPARIPARARGSPVPSAAHGGQFRSVFFFCSLEHILLLYSAGVVIYRDRERRDDHEDENADGGSQGVVVLIHSELIEPGNQQVGLARLVIVQCEGTASRKQINDVEVVEYWDQTEYMNISAATTKYAQNRELVNPRYFDQAFYRENGRLIPYDNGAFTTDEIN